jgi:thiol:disulfide interchange protein
MRVFFEPVRTEADVMTARTSGRPCCFLIHATWCGACTRLKKGLIDDKAPIVSKKFPGLFAVDASLTPDDVLRTLLVAAGVASLPSEIGFPAAVFILSGGSSAPEMAIGVTEVKDLLTKFTKLTQTY